jgi:hypothetical protein
MRLTIAALLLFQLHAADAALTARIEHLLHSALTTGDDKQEKAIEAEVRQIYKQRGLPAIADVGDKASYDFVFMICSPGGVLDKVRAAAARHEIPADAAAYCEAHVRQESVKLEAMKHAPTEPQLRDEIERLYKVDQAVRQQNESDMEKMARTDREHAAPLEAIFAKYGVPTYRMVGPEGASDFVVMIQHQSPEFRAKVLPKLKANVEAGQADPGSYGMMFDRSQTDAGKKQMYGANLTCDTENPKLHKGPIEDEEHVDQRRAAIGLMRLELYTRLVIEMSPNVCPVTPAAK